jgi:putative protease
VPGEGDHALSLRDLSLLEHIDELTMLGVTSLKIEGRLKRPEYVAASVSELRRALDGGQPDMKLLESVFSRSGFTDGYFTGRRDRSMFGVRTKENVVSAKDVLKEIALTVNTEPAKWPLDMKFAMHAGETASLTVSTVNGDVTGTSRSQTDIRIAASELMSEPGISVTVTGPVPETALTAELTEERLRAQMAKLGGTPYFLNDFTAELDAGLMLRSSDLNNMRRAAVSRIAEKRIEFFEQNVKMPSFSRKSDVLGQLSRETLTIHQNTPPIYVKNANSSRTESHTADHQLRIRIQRTTQLTPFLREQATFVIAPLKTALELADGFMHEYPGKLIAELPAVAFDDNTGQIMNLIELLPGQGVQHFSAGNLYAIEMLRKAASRLQGYSPQGSFTEAGILLHGDSGLNITNSRSLQACLDMGLTDVTISPELGKQRIIKLDGLEYAGILAYGYLPLMQLRNCPAGPCPVKNPKQGFLAASCSLTDRFGKKFPVDCTDGISTLHNCVPLYIGDKQAAFLDRPLFYTLYFTSETSKKCELITRSFLNEDRLSGELTGGLYFR